MSEPTLPRVRHLATRLGRASYLRFPFTIDETGGVESDRIAHVREQIEQVLFTSPGERWFRPEFGVGVMASVFEPNAPVLHELTRKRLLAALTDTLAGEVDPRTLDVTVAADVDFPERLLITIAYTLATISHSERHTFAIGGGSHG